MSHVYLKNEFYQLSQLLESERVDRVLSNKGSVWDYRHALLVAQLGIVKPVIAESVRNHFLLLNEDRRAQVFYSMIDLNASESKHSEWV